MQGDIIVFYYFHAYNQTYETSKKNWKRQINVFLLSGSGFEGPWPWPWPWGGPWESPSKGVMFKCSSMHSKEGKVSLCYRLFNRSLCETLTFWKKVRKWKLPVEDRSFLLTVFMSVQLIPGIRQQVIEHSEPNKVENIRLDFICNRTH